MSRIIIALIMFATGCATVSALTRSEVFFADNVPAKEVKQKYRVALEGRLLDPESLKTRSVKFYHPSKDGRHITVVCGLFDGRNSMGGYGGYIPFISNGVRTKIGGQIRYGIKVMSSYWPKIAACICSNQPVENNPKCMK